MVTNNISIGVGIGSFRIGFRIDILTGVGVGRFIGNRIQGIIHGINE